MMDSLVKKCRSFRRFDEADRIPESELVRYVDVARLTASSCNGQPLKYRVVSDPEKCAELFPFLAWAGALKDWDGPVEGERPTGYIVIFRDEELKVTDAFTQWDEGIVAQTIMLTATEAGWGGCMIGSFAKASVARACGVDTEKLAPRLVLALGRPAEDVRLTLPGEDGSIKYYRDENDVHWVPKRPLEDVLL